MSLSSLGIITANKSTKKSKLYESSKTKVVALVIM